MPVTIHGKPGRIECCIIKGSAPLLLSRNTMKSLRACLDFEAETISIAGSEPQSAEKLCRSIHPECHGRGTGDGSVPV